MLKPTRRFEIKNFLKSGGGEGFYLRLQDAKGVGVVPQLLFYDLIAPTKGDKRRALCKSSLRRTSNLIIYQSFMIFLCRVFYLKAATYTNSWTRSPSKLFSERHQPK